MPVKFGCPKCNSTIKISSKIPFGAPVQCPTCASVFPNPAKYQKGGRNHHHSSSRRSSGKGVKIGRLALVVVLILLLGVAGGGGWFLYSKYGIPGMGSTSKEEAKNTKTDSTGPGTTTNENAVNTGNGKEDPLAYVPADANLVLGFKAPAVLAHPLLKSVFDQALAQVMPVKTLVDCKGETGLENKDFFDTTLIAMRMPGGAAKPESVTVVLKSATAFDQKKLGQWASTAGPQKLKDKFYYVKHKDAPLFNTVYMPSDKLLVMSDRSPNQLEALFTGDGTKLLVSPDTVGLIRKIDRNPFWLARPFDPAAREDFGAYAKLMPADLQAVYRRHLGAAKAFALYAGPDGNDVKLALGLACANDAAAQELTGGLQASWEKHKDGASKSLESAPALLKEVLASLQFAKTDVLAEASAKLSAGGLEPVVKGGLGSVQKNFQDSVAMAEKVATAAPPPDPLANFKMTPEEERIFNLVNNARTQDTKKPLKPSPVLFISARAHAANMAKKEDLSDELDGKDTAARLKDAGYKVNPDKTWGNLTADKNLGPDQAFQVWFGAAASKASILEDAIETGIGIGKSEKGDIYYYQIYATPK
jgi:uncharacterized protein YkwD